MYGCIYRYTNQGPLITSVKTSESKLTVDMEAQILMLHNFKNDMLKSIICGCPQKAVENYQ